MHEKQVTDDTIQEVLFKKFTVNSYCSEKNMVCDPSPLPYPLHYMDVPQL